jgi:hypothetical protein
LPLLRATLTLNLAWAIAVFLWLLRLWALNPTSMRIWAFTAIAGLYLILAARARRGVHWARVGAFGLATVMALRWIPRILNLLALLASGRASMGAPAFAFVLTGALLYGVPATLVAAGLAWTWARRGSLRDDEVPAGESLMTFRPKTSD